MSKKLNAALNYYKEFFSKCKEIDIVKNHSSNLNSWESLLQFVSDLMCRNDRGDFDEESQDK